MRAGAVGPAARNERGSQREHVCTLIGSCSRPTTHAGRQPALQLQRSLVRSDQVHAARGSCMIHCCNEEFVQAGNKHA